MSGTTPTLDQVSQNAIQREVTINDNNAALDGAALFARRASLCAGLTWAWYGGRLNGIAVGNDSDTLADNATNYMVVELTTLDVSFDTASTDWDNPDNYGRAYKITTSGGVVTGWEDHRWGTLGVLSSGAGGADISALTTLGDIPVYDGSALDRLGVGSDGQIIIADSGETLGMKWASPSNVGGASNLIQEVVTSGSQSVVTFSSIPPGYRHLEIFYICRDTATGTAGADFFMKFNNDGTAANYVPRQYQGVSNGAANAGSTSATTNGFPIGGCPGSLSYADAFGSGRIHIPGYAQTIFHKAAHGMYFYVGGSILVEGHMSCAWKSTTAISQIDLTAGVTAFLNGSIFSLYGRL